MEIEMTTKKVYRLKKPVKIILVLLILVCISLPFAIKKYKEYLYTKTYEYKLLQVKNEKTGKSYSLEDVKLMLSMMNDKQTEKLLTYDYNEFIPEFFKAKYFMFKNLDGYLGQVITQEEDFFKYHGTEGYNYDDIVSKVNTHTDRPFYEETLETDMSKEYLILTNKYYALKSDYEPSDLVSVDWKYRLGGATEYKYIRKDVYDAYVEMWNAAKAEDIYLLVDSGYRAYDKQAEVYKYYENINGTAGADKIAARPGYSEHQTGLALDIYSKENTSSSTFKDSRTYAWLIDNCYKYGFILRYPENKQKITGYNYESWHYRYVGKDMAKKIHDEGITFDEYYAYYLED